MYNTVRAHASPSKTTHTYSGNIKIATAIKTTTAHKSNANTIFANESVTIDFRARGLRPTETTP